MQPARRLLSSAGAAAAGRKPSAPAFTCHGSLTRRGPPPPPPQQRRAFSRSAPRHAAAAPTGPSRAGLARLDSRRLISISGPDAAKYLQGVVTANLLTGAGPGLYAVFLTAQGRILHDVIIYPDTRPTIPNPGNGESFLLEADAAQADLLQRHIKRYKLRAKFTVRLLDPGEGTVWHAWNDDDPLPSPHSNSSSSSSISIITAPDLRAPGLGHRILTFNTPNTPDFAPPNTTTTTPLPLPAVHEEVYRLRRYLLGVPEGQAEILREQALPQESNIDVMGGIDFRKGCYVGQELTIRTEHRGVVRKRVLPCLLYPSESEGVPEAALGGGLEGLYRPGIGEVGGGVGAEMVPAEASIGRVGKKGRSAGKWLRGVGNVGLALCRLEIMTDVVLPGETGGGGLMRGMSLLLGWRGVGRMGRGRRSRSRRLCRIG